MMNQLISPDSQQHEGKRTHMASLIQGALFPVVTQ
jgi:hypothetical protein